MSRTDKILYLSAINRYLIVNLLLSVAMECVFKKRRLGAVELIVCIVSFVVAIFMSIQIGQFLILLPLIGPLVIIARDYRTHYIIKEDGILEVHEGFGRVKIIDQLKGITWQPDSWLRSRVKVSYRSTFEVCEPDNPKAFIEALQKHNADLRVELL